MLRCTAVQTQRAKVIRHDVKISKVPLVLGFGCQCTMSVPLPHRRALIPNSRIDHKLVIVDKDISPRRNLPKVCEPENRDSQG